MLCMVHPWADTQEQLGVEDLAQGHLISSWGRRLFAPFLLPEKFNSVTFCLQSCFANLEATATLDCTIKFRTFYSTAQSSMITLRCFPWVFFPLLPYSRVSLKDEASLFPHPNNLYNLPRCFSFIILYRFSSSVLNLPLALLPMNHSLLFLSLTLTRTHTHTLSPADVATLNRFNAPSIWSTVPFYFQYNTSQSCMLMVYCFGIRTSSECIVWLGCCQMHCHLLNWGDVKWQQGCSWQK